MKRLSIPLCAALALSACQPSEALQCGAEHDAVLLQQIRSGTAYALRTDLPQLSAAEAEQVLNSIRFTLSGHNGTATEDDASCTARLHLAVPPEWKTRISESMLLTRQQSGFSEPADGLTPDSSGYSMPLSYDLNRHRDTVEAVPTSGSIATAARLPAYYLKHGQLSTAVQAPAAQNIDLQVSQMAQAADAREQLDKLRQSHPRIRGRLDQYWNSLPADTRSALESGQSEWQNRMAAECRREAVYGIPPEQTEAEQLKCEADRMLARLDELPRLVRAQTAAERARAAELEAARAAEQDTGAAELAAAQAQHRAAQEDLATLLRGLPPSAVPAGAQERWQRETAERCRSRPDGSAAAQAESLNCETAATLARIQELLQQAR